jgi:hypothetical protein
MQLNLAGDNVIKSPQATTLICSQRHTFFDGNMKAKCTYQDPFLPEHFFLLLY